MGRKEGESLNPQLAEDLLSGLEQGISDETNIEELWEQFYRDEIAQDQRKSITRVKNALKRSDVTNIAELKEKLRSGKARALRDVGPKAIDFLIALTDDR